MFLRKSPSHALFFASTCNFMSYFLQITWINKHCLLLLACPIRVRSSAVSNNTQDWCTVSGSQANSSHYTFKYVLKNVCIHMGLYRSNTSPCRSQWPRGLRRGSAAADLLKSWVQIPPVAWMSVCCECCVLSGRGLCDELITRPEESYRLWYVVVWDIETSWMRRPWPTGGCRSKIKTLDPINAGLELWTFISVYLVNSILSSGMQFCCIMCNYALR